jgi:hypothetical protein
VSAPRLIALVAAAVLVAAAAVWVSLRSAPQRAAPGQIVVLAALPESIDAVSQVRLTRGDGTATALQRDPANAAAPWSVVQRNYPADSDKLRALLINLSALHVLEQKTSDPARYPLLEVEDASGDQSHSVRVDVAAGARTWSLLVGKAAEPNGSFVRIPGQAAALLVQPRISVDPLPAHWIASDLLDLPADRVQQVLVKPVAGPAYAVARERRQAADLALRPVPPGRKANAAAVNSVAATLFRLGAQDVQAPPSTASGQVSQASLRTFDGLQLDLQGYRDGTRTWVRIDASFDAATVRRFAPPKADASDAKTGQTGGADAASEATALSARLHGHDFEIPAFKFDAIFRPLEDLLVPRPGARPTAATRAHP